MRTVSHYELSRTLSIIVEVAQPSVFAIRARPRAFSYGRGIQDARIGDVFSDHRKGYSHKDAMDVCEMLNERLAYNKQASPAAAPLSNSGRGVTSASDSGADVVGERRA